MSDQRRSTCHASPGKPKLRLPARVLERTAVFEGAVRLCAHSLDRSGRGEAVRPACHAPYADALPFARKLVAEVPDRVVWGTDWPHRHPAGPVPDDGVLVDIIAEIAPSEELRRKLMVENPRRLDDREGSQ